MSDQPGLARSLLIAAVFAALVFVASTLVNGGSVSILWLVIAVVTACLLAVAFRACGRRSAR